MFSTSKSLISIAALVASGFVVSTPAMAVSTCDVNDFTDGAGTSDDRTLRYCLANISDGGAITFSSASDETITVDTPLVLSANAVTINGGEEVTIKRGTGTNHSLMEITGSPSNEETTTLQGLIFDGRKLSSGVETEVGVTTSGGAVSVDDQNTKLVVDSSTFKWHTITGDNNNGGAIESNGEVIIQNNSIFTDNASQEHAGAVYTSTSPGKSVSISNSTFERNVSHNDGGAVHSGKNVSIDDGSTFTDNNTKADSASGSSGDGDGGAVYGDDEITVSGDSTFTGNEAGDDGGAIYARNYLDIEDAEFTNNKATDKGGAVYSSQDNVDASRVEFVGNVAADDGGAIDSNGGLIENSYFKANESEKRGGAIHTGDNADVRGTSFVDNKAEEDGGAVEAGTGLSVKSSFFRNNEAGASSGSGSGGAIRAESGSVDNSTFFENSTNRYGGAINFVDLDSSVAYSSFVNNSADSAGISLSVTDGEGDDPIVDLFANLFLSSSSDLHLDLRNDATATDLGANVSTSADSSFLDAETSEVSVDYASLGVGTPATATLSLRPFVPIDSISTLEVEVTEDLADNYETVTSETLATVDQQGTTRTYSFYPGAEFIAFGVSSTPAPYSGPLVTNIGSTPEDLITSTPGGFTVAEKDTVTVSGERLSTVSKVVVGGLEGEVISTSANSFEMVVPEGLAPGNYDLEIQSSIGNLTYLGAFVVSSSPVSSQAFGEVTAWTTRVSDTQVKVYVKYPTVGEKLRIGHQSGGSGSYESVFVKTTASEDDPSMIVNEHGSYIVRTIDLENINRIRVTVGEQKLVQVRYNN